MKNPKVILDAYFRPGANGFGRLTVDSKQRAAY